MRCFQSLVDLAGTRAVTRRAALLEPADVLREDACADIRGARFEFVADRTRRGEVAEIERGAECGKRAGRTCAEELDELAVQIGAAWRAPCSQASDHIGVDPGKGFRRLDGTWRG